MNKKITTGIMIAGATIMSIGLVGCGAQNTKQAKVLKDGVDVELTAVEYKLLLILLNNRGVVLSRNKLLENMWDIEGDFVNDNTLTVYIKRLRDKIEEDSANPAIVKTVRGLGYIIDNEE